MGVGGEGIKEYWMPEKMTCPTLTHCARSSTMPTLLNEMLSISCIPKARAAFTIELWNLSSALFQVYKEMLFVLHSGQLCGSPQDSWLLLHLQGTGSYLNNVFVSEKSKPMEKNCPFTTTSEGKRHSGKLGQM